jgi:hypothetical protein
MPKNKTRFSLELKSKEMPDIKDSHFSENFLVHYISSAYRCYNIRNLYLNIYVFIYVSRIETL